MYTIQLYSVNRSEKASEPVSVQARPLTPNYAEVFNTIHMVEDWGGATVYFENPSEADLAITIIHVDSTGFWSQGETLYTKRRQGSFSVHDLPPVRTDFGVYIRDRWNNMTDTFVVNLLPKFEKQMNPSKFQEVRLPGDNPMSTVWHIFLSSLWDGDLSKITDATGAMFLTVPDGTWPHWCTFDMGVEEGAILSRVKLWQRAGYNNQFSWHDRNIRKFEIWGSMNPNPNGSWDDSWTFLMEGEIIKPSGLPLGENSDEDIQALLGGHEFSFPLDVPYVRYIRIKCTETMNKAQAFCLMQCMLWGQEPSDIQ